MKWRQMVSDLSLSCYLFPQVLCNPANPKQQSVHGGGGQQLSLWVCGSHHHGAHWNQVYPFYCVGPAAAAETGKGETTGRKLEGDVPKREGLHPLPMYGEKCLSYLVPSFDPWNSEWEKQPSETCLNYSQHNESLKCERLKAQKIRRRPESCHGFHPEASLRTISILFPIRFTMSTSWWPGTTAETWLMRKYFLSES